MNKIFQLFDQEYILNLFKKEILPQYPDCNDITKIEIKPAKKNIWETTYHVVVQFDTYFAKNGGGEKNISIFCSAHSNEPRKRSFEALNFLWNNDFSKGNLTIPRPLFFSNYFNAYFYEGVKGKNLYHYIKINSQNNIESIIKKAAELFAKLHHLPVEKAKNFNEENSRIETVIPGMDEVLKRINIFFPKYYDAYKKIYHYVDKQEKEFLASTQERWIIHGDAHPENIIKISRTKIGLIDFTDICLADFARDLGSFIQQLEFMSSRKNLNPEYVEKIKKLFLDTYLDCAKISLNPGLQKRIDCYFNWTSMRTANFFLLKEVPEPERAHGLIIKVCENLKIDCQI